METCKEYDIMGSGYNYADFFHVKKMQNNKLAENEKMHLKFYVMTSMDAHILLSVNSKPRPLDRVYEIVIGAGSNTFSTLRTYMGRRRVSVSMDAYLLSVFEPTPIEIIQTKDGLINIFIPGYQKEPLLNYTDPSPLDINYVSFSTFGTVTAKWYYDCEFDGFVSEMMQEERLLTPQALLVANITAKVVNKTQPPLLDAINFAFEIKSVALEKNSQIMTTRLHLFTYWQDERLAWNPQDFKGVDTLVKPSLDIWLPSVVIINGVKIHLLHFEAIYVIKVKSNGNVSLLAANAELSTWCPSLNKDWPYERRYCELQIGLYDAENLNNKQVYLEFDNTKPLPKEQISTLSEWQLLQVSVGEVDNDQVERFSNNGVMQTIKKDLKIGFLLEENSKFYKNIFSIPIFVSQILIILSFTLAGYRKGALLLVVFIILCLGLMFITHHAPTSYEPNIVIAYQHVIRIVTGCYWLHVILYWFQLYPPKTKPTDTILTLLNSTPLRFMFCLRFSDSTEYVDILEHPWRKIANILSNLSLIITNIAFIVINFLLLQKFLTIM